MQKKIAALDVDGVLLDCDGAFCTVASHYLNRPLRALNRAYELNVRYGITQEQVYEVFEEMKNHPQGWGGMPALQDAINSARLLQENGYRVELVTAISQDLEEMRLACLAAHNFVPDAIHCAGHHTASKKAIVEEMDPVMIVDDRLKHLYDCDKVPYRVWVDHGDEQDGLEFDSSQLFRVRSLEQWVTQWMEHYHNQDSKRAAHP